jgi:hypothetical protein
MWLLPDVNAIPPRYDQISVKDLISNELGCIASGQVDAPIHLHNKNASLHVGRYDLASKIELPNNKKLFIYVARGALEFEGTNYAQGSSLLISDPMTDTSAKCSDNSEIVIWSVDSKARAMSSMETKCFVSDNRYRNLESLPEKADQAFSKSSRSTNMFSRAGRPGSFKYNPFSLQPLMIMKCPV